MCETDAVLFYSLDWIFRRPPLLAAQPTPLSTRRNGNISRFVAAYNRMDALDGLKTTYAQVMFLDLDRTWPTKAPSTAVLGASRSANGQHTVRV